MTKCHIDSDSWEYRALLANAVKLWWNGQMEWHPALIWVLLDQIWSELWTGVAVAVVSSKCIGQKLMLLLYLVYEYSMYFTLWVYERWLLLINTMNSVLN